jgi:uncharacterized protein
MSQLTVNADATGGEVRIEILTPGGYRVAGFTRDQSVVITGDSLEHMVGWSQKTMADLVTGRYLLRVHLKNASLFSLTIRHDRTIQAAKRLTKPGQAD